jgi:hypothetical protein
VLFLAVCGASAEGPGSLPAALDAAQDASSPEPPSAETASPRSVPLSDAGALPWQTGTPVGYGVAFKDTKNPAGDSIFIGYAGYQVPIASAEAWVEALYDASLAARGVRYLWAVQGPNHRTYSHFEIGNSEIVTAMLPLVGPRTHFILVAGHSSGSFVAHELLGKLAGGMDPRGLTEGRVVYFDLDGGESGLTPQSVGRLRKAYFVGSHDGKTGTDSPRRATMQSLGATYASAGGYWQNDASSSGCEAGARWCVHSTFITTRPHDSTNVSARLDYSDFSGRPVCHSWIDAKAEEAGLLP